MNIKNFIQQFQSKPVPQQELDDEIVLKFLKVLEKAREDELSCDEMYSRLDEFVESVLASKDAALLYPLLREHLDMCSDCCEEYEALLAVLKNAKEKS